MNDAESGFGFDANQISIIKKDFTLKSFSLKTKKQVAADIVSEIASCLEENAQIEERLQLDLYESAWF